MKLRLNVASTKKQRAWVQAIPRRLSFLKTYIGREVAKKVVDEVKDRIPHEGGWYDIYRDAISMHEDATGSQWAVAGLTKLKFESIPAASSLIWLGDERWNGALAALNPWPVDLIPSIEGGIEGSSEVKPATEAVVTKRRDVLRPKLDDLRTVLREQGVVLKENELPKIKGVVYADLKFLSRQLERGLNGIKKKRVWGSMPKFIRANAQEWVEEPKVAKKIGEIMDGKYEPDPAADLVAKILARLKREGQS